MTSANGLHSAPGKRALDLDIFDNISGLARQMEDEWALLDQ